MAAADSKRKDPKDPRFRVFRGLAYGAYIAVVSVFCLLVIWSVSRSVAAMTPERLPQDPQALTFRECLDGAQGLWGELEREREALVRLSPARQVDREWMTFRTRWLTDLRALEARCAPGARGREPLGAIFKRLEQVVDLYTTHAVQYALEVGGHVDALQEAFARARKDPAAGRLPPAP